MRPVRNAGNYDALDIGKNLIERSACFRRRCLQLRQHRAGLGIGGDRTVFDFLSIIRDPIRHLVEMFSENVRGDVAQGRGRFGLWFHS